MQVYGMQAKRRFKNTVKQTNNAAILT